MNAQLLRASDAAYLLGISKSFLYLLVKKGEIRSIHIGTAIRFREQDLNEFVEKNLSNHDSMKECPLNTFNSQ